MCTPCAARSARTWWRPCAANDGGALTTAEAVALLRADVSGGAASIARKAAEILEQLAKEAPAGNSLGLVTAVTRACLAILDAQPAMAPLVTLAREVLGPLDPEAPVQENRRRAAAAASAFAGAQGGRIAAAAARAAAVLPTGRPVLTLSASSAVEETLAAAVLAHPPAVVCLEGRPMCEGRLLASALSGRGIRVTLAVDAALESVITTCGAVLLGADSVGDRGIVNKIGSAAASHAARRHGIPVFVVADSSKLLPPGFPQPLDDDRPAVEVWSGHGPVEVWNRYFEVFPGSLVDGVVTDLGSFDPRALDLRRAGLFVPASLKAWAASRT